MDTAWLLHASTALLFLKSGVMPLDAWFGLFITDYCNSFVILIKFINIMTEELFILYKEETKPAQTKLFKNKIKNRCDCHVMSFM